MQQPTDATTPRKGGRIFYFTTISLLLGAIVVAIIQKRREGDIVVVATKMAVGTEGTEEDESNVQDAIQDAAHWEILSLAVVSLAILSWGIAIWRREKLRWAWPCVVVLLSLYVLLELMVV